MLPPYQVRSIARPSVPAPRSVGNRRVEGPVRRVRHPDRAADRRTRYGRRYVRATSKPGLPGGFRRSFYAWAWTAEMALRVSPKQRPATLGNTVTLRGGGRWR